jgi:hypothetical protein
LGLSIAKEITVAHGGRIWVKSKPGQGSAFYVLLNTAIGSMSANEPDTPLSTNKRCGPKTEIPGFT